MHRHLFPLVYDHVMAAKTSMPELMHRHLCMLICATAGVRGFPNAGGPLVIDLASLLGPLFIMFVMQVGVELLLS
jgi:hypothetical protein